MFRAPAQALTREDLLWVVGSFCAIHRKPFDPELFLRQFPPPYTTDTLIVATRALGFRCRATTPAAGVLASLHFPCVAMLRDAPAGPAAGPYDTVLERVPGSGEGEPATGGETAPVITRPAMMVQVGPEGIVFFAAGTNTPVTLPSDEFAHRYTGTVFQLASAPAALKDPDGAQTSRAPFGFRWFLPELVKHRKVWREVLLASLVIQLLALATPLFTQVVIDKVVVHRTSSTLIVIAVGMAIFMVFSSLLTWVRQYLVLHTGNRVDAVLGAAVVEHLFKLPARYFEHRPTGVITARLRGVEAIREFIASAAVTLVLDLPFLGVFIAIMFYYSVSLTLITLAVLAVIVILSLIVAPIFRERLNEQFLLAARNQAFATEYVAGIETVKSLQMEPQLSQRYGDYLAEYLRSGFGVRQIGNTYNVLANGLEQTLLLLILAVGAYHVMHSSAFTIGMLIAFQMFAQRLSQPTLRLVGLWQQFQQANLAVARLGDIMNVAAEPYSLLPSRGRPGSGTIEIEDLSFRYNEALPFLYTGFSLTVAPGRIIAITGPSGCGKSTLAKLLQAFYPPTSGTIRIDGTDIRHLSANELRHYFGVVPQETILFSGTVHENLLLANPQASFEQVVQAARMAEIHEVIERLPQGYQTEIGERGVGLSGGQRQRLAIARALLKGPKILIFDEATSNLDPVTAEHFAATINQLKGRATILFIAHALPKNLQIDEGVRLGTGTLGAVGAPHERISEAKPQERAAQLA